ncbi:hypothetical protein [Aliamphritea spongicola]|nr:hypothetical protein [Aliamphritea spongicola]
MPQYTCIINLTKKLKFKPTDAGAYNKQAEWSETSFGAGMILSLLTSKTENVISNLNVTKLLNTHDSLTELIGTWHGDQIIVTGDAAEAEHPYETTTSDKERLYFSSDFEDIGEFINEWMTRTPYIRGILLEKHS